MLAVSAFLFWPEKGEKEESEAEEVQKKQIYVLCAYETKLHQQILKEVAEKLFQPLRLCQGEHGVHPKGEL